MVVRTSLTALLVVAASVAWATAEDQMPWVEDLSVACQQASAEGKLVLLHVYSDDCPPCVKLERNVFSRPDIAAAVTKNFVPVKVHAKHKPELVAKYGVRAWPTDVFLTPTGMEIYKTVSPQDPTDYTNLVNSLAAQTGTGLGRNGNSLPTHQQIAANGPGGSAAAQQASNQPQANQQPTANVPPATPFGPWVAAGNAARETVMVPSAHATQQVQWMAQGAAASAQQAQQSLQQAQQTAQQSFQQAQQNAQQAGQQTWQHAQTQVNQTVDATRQTAAQTTQQVTQTANDSTAAAAAAAKEVINRHTQPLQNQAAAVGAFSPWQAAAGAGIPQQPAAVAQAPAVQTLTPSVDQQPATQTAPAPALASGTYPLAMEGFCPVTLLNEGKWKKGAPEFGAVHRRRTFLFSTAAAQQAFMASPDRFSPVMVGYDPVKFMQSGELVDGRVTYGLTYRKQIYLFSDDASLKAFWQNPRQVTEGLRQAMTQQERTLR